MTNIKSVADMCRKYCTGCGHSDYCGSLAYDNLATSTGGSSKIQLECDSTAIKVNDTIFPTIQDMITNCKELTLEDTLLWTKFVKENKT